MSERDADHYRYRALLKDADDEPKRLALIQLLIDEGARDKLAAKAGAAKLERMLPLPAVMPWVRPELSSHEAALPKESQELPDAAFTRTGEASRNFVNLAEGLIHVREAQSGRPLSRPSELQAHRQSSGATELPNVRNGDMSDARSTAPSPAAAAQTAKATPRAPIRPEDSAANDLADRIALLLSSRVAALGPAQVATPGASAVGPVSDHADTPIDVQIRSILAKPDRQ
jgi:hypothetical protein